MPDAYLEDLKRRIATGEYAVDSAALAQAIITKMALVRRTRRFLANEDERGSPGERQPSPERARRGQRRSQVRIPPRGQRLR